MNPSAFSIDDFCSRYGIGRSTIYDEIRTGRLEAVKVGRRTLITEQAGQDWLRSLPKAGEAAASRNFAEPLKKSRRARFPWREISVRAGLLIGIWSDHTYQTTH